MESVFADLAILGRAGKRVFDADEVWVMSVVMSFLALFMNQGVGLSPSLSLGSALEIPSLPTTIMCNSVTDREENPAGFNFRIDFDNSKKPTRFRFLDTRKGQWTREVVDFQIRESNWQPITPWASANYPELSKSVSINSEAQFGGQLLTLNIFHFLRADGSSFGQQIFGELRSQIGMELDPAKSFFMGDCGGFYLEAGVTK